MNFQYIDAQAIKIARAYGAETVRSDCLLGAIIINKNQRKRNGIEGFFEHIGLEVEEISKELKFELDKIVTARSEALPSVEHDSPITKSIKSYARYFKPLIKDSDAIMVLLGITMNHKGLAYQVLERVAERKGIKIDYIEGAIRSIYLGEN
ncbi:MAG: hypothetical protein AABW79_00780 [Nanoarchaeota archaeon]